MKREAIQQAIIAFQINKVFETELFKVKNNHLFFLRKKIARKNKNGLTLFADNMQTKSTMNNGDKVFCINSKLHSYGIRASVSGCNKLKEY